MSEVGAQKPPLAIVVAVGRNGAIGRAGRLPWTMPSDLARFREVTMGKPMLMGRHTFDSIGRVLPGRETIVVTRSTPTLPAGVWHAVDPQAAIALATTRAAAVGADEIALIGGAMLFSEMMPCVDRLHVTHIDLAPDADTFFPPIDPGVWRETARFTRPPHQNDEATCVFVDYVRG